MKEIKLFWLCAGEFFSSLGMSFIWPLASVYLHDRLAIPLSIIGIVLLFNSLASVFGSYLSGILYDRSDPYRLLLAGIIFAIAILTLLIFFNGWIAFSILLFCIGIASGWNLTLVNSIATSIHSKDGRQVFMNIYFAQNLGVVAGTSIVGFLYSISVDLLFLIAAALYICFFFVVLLKFKIIKYKPGRKIENRTGNELIEQSSPTANRALLVIFFISLVIIWIMYQQWVSNLSVYMTGMHISLQDYSFLWTMNAALIVCIQMILSWFNNNFGNRISAYFQVEAGLLMFTMSFVALFFARQYLGFVIAMVFLTFGESLAIPTIPSVVNSLTPEAYKGRNQGFVNSCSSLGRAIGPLFGGLIIDNSSYFSLFLIASLSFLLVLLVVGFVWQLSKKRLTNFR